MFPVDTVQGIQTNAVRGTLTIRQALDRMLAGTPLVVVEDRATGALTVARRNNAPAPEDRMAAVQPATSQGEGRTRPGATGGMDTVQLPQFHVSSCRPDAFVGTEPPRSTWPAE